jgi:hypothetical protein
LKLELASYKVEELRLGERTRLERGVLTVDPAEIAALVQVNENIEKVSVAVALPGDSTRIIHVTDAVEPRFKPEPGAVTFPGLLGAADLAGTGRTNRITGAVVVATVELPPGANNDGGVKEAIIDMSGPGVPYCPFAQTRNLVVHFTMKAGVSLPEMALSWRLATLKVAQFIGAVTRDLPPDSVETLELEPVKESLPRVVYVLPSMIRGDVHATLWYGFSITTTPTLAHPNEVLDNGMVSADYFISSHRFPTYYYQNDPIIRELYKRHGRDINFVGVLLGMCLIPGEAEKYRQAVQMAKMARMLAADGAVVTVSTGGHTYADQMLICQELERNGIKTVLGVDEYCGEDGKGFPLVTYVAEALAIVSTGNQESVIELPAVERVLGGHEYLPGTTFDDGYRPHPADTIKVTLRDLYVATTQNGFTGYRARPY